MGTAGNGADGKYRDQVLLSTVILGEILKHLDLPRLKSHRLTCKHWNWEISRLLSLRSIHVNLSVKRGQQNESLWSKFLSTFESHDPATPYPFRDMSFNPLSVSIEDSTWALSNFRITELVIRKDGGFITPELGKYAISVIRKCSPTLRTLECPYLGDWDDDGESLLGGKLEFPVLEELRPFDLCYDQWPSPPSNQQQVDFFSRIISSLPTLKISLSLRGYRHIKPLLRQAKLDTVRLVLRPGDSQDSAYLDLLDILKAGSLTDLNWKSYGVITQARATEALSHFTSSLQRLCISWSSVLYPDPAHPISFPLCPALTHLEVRDLHMDVLSWGNLPNLRCLKFTRIRKFDLNSNNFVPSLSVRKISCRGDTVKWTESLEEGPKMEATFLKLFQRFPNATAWKAHHKDVIPFCKAVKGSSQVVRKFSVYLHNRDCHGDRDLTYFVDRYVFSLLPSLHELEELVLENATLPGLEMKLAEIDFPRMSNLKCLKVYNYDPPEEECGALGSIPKVLMVSSRSKWSDPIASLPNVEFRQSPFKDRVM